MATATEEPTRLTVSLYLLRASKVSEALQQLEAASASSSTLIESIPEGKFLALPSPLCQTSCHLSLFASGLSAEVINNETNSLPP
jgi:hypothetical protein